MANAGPGCPLDAGTGGEHGAAVPLERTAHRRSVLRAVGARQPMVWLEVDSVTPSAGA